MGKVPSRYQGDEKQVWQINAGCCNMRFKKAGMKPNRVVRNSDVTSIHAE
jgi:hypothetical protein